MNARFDVAVVGRARDVAAVAAAVGLELAARSDPRAALVIAAGGGRCSGIAPGTAPARRLRERLRARDLQARSAGRLVWCAVDGEDVAEQVERAAAVGGPVVLAVCGPREPWVEPLLEDAELVLVAGGEADPLTLLALAGLRARGLASASSAAPEGAGAAFARAGLGAPAWWRPADARAGWANP